jgi:hypothetical protein
MAAGKWERTARAAVKQYRHHPDYEDILSVAQIAAWQSPERAYIAALNAARMYLRSPENIHRTHTRSGRELLPPLSLDGEGRLEAERRMGLDYRNPEALAVARVWKEWCLKHPDLTQRERLMLTLWVQSTDTFAQISSQAGASRTYANVMVEKACAKIRGIMGVTRPIRQTKVSEAEVARIRDLAAAGMPKNRIARAVSRDKKTVLNVLRSETSP